MENITWLLTGGFLKGYRTYVLAGVGVVTVVVGWAVGDISTHDAIREAALSLSAATVRAGLNS